MADALLFRVIATTATDVPVGAVDDWLWQGPTPALAEVAARLGAPTWPIVRSEYGSEQPLVRRGTTTPADCRNAADCRRADCRTR
jgi:hypothetical protein